MYIYIYIYNVAKYFPVQLQASQPHMSENMGYFTLQKSVGPGIHSAAPFSLHNWNNPYNVSSSTSFSEFLRVLDSCPTNEVMRTLHLNWPKILMASKSRVVWHTTVTCYVIWQLYIMKYACRYIEMCSANQSIFVCHSPLD